jgi:hypothetical protein
MPREKQNHSAIHFRMLQFHTGNPPAECLINKADRSISRFTKQNKKTELNVVLLNANWLKSVLGLNIHYTFDYP